MVVMVIISVLIGLAVLSTGFASTSRELDSEAERLAGLIGVLTDEAVLDNREYGLRPERDAYQVLRYDEAKARWLPVARDSHRLPEWAELTFELDGQPLVLAGSKGEKEQKKGTDQPQLLILSSGELSPFRLRLAERGTRGAGVVAEQRRFPPATGRGGAAMKRARGFTPAGSAGGPGDLRHGRGQRAQCQRAQLRRTPRGWKTRPWRCGSPTTVSTNCNWNRRRPPAAATRASWSSPGAAGSGAPRSTAPPSRICGG